ncbi:MAG: Ku protein, partial [Actinomycetota bacterium]|nr:Ku protein [Actinomycetota bacterium]
RVAKGTYVTISADELASVAPEKSRTVDIEDFVAIADIDPIYFETTYYLSPASSRSPSRSSVP